MLAANLMRRGQKIMQQSQGEHKLLYAGETFTFTKSTESRGKTISIDGDQVRVLVTIIVSKGDWTGAAITADNDIITVDTDLITVDQTGEELPISGTTATFEKTGLRYRIGDVRQDPYDALWIIDLVNPHVADGALLPGGIGSMVIGDDFVVS